jgi:hypothetical protein
MNVLFKKRFLQCLNSRSDLLISSEALGSWFLEDAIADLRSDLSAAGFTKFHIVLYVRDPADYFLSYTQQVIKSTFSFAPLGEQIISFRYPFRAIADRWEKAFPGSLIVRKYVNLQEGNVVSDFSKLLGDLLKIDIPCLNSVKNTSLSAEGMKILQDYRLLYSNPHRPGVLTRDSEKLRNFLVTSTSSIMQTKASLKDELALWIRANHRNDANFLLERYGIDLELPEAVLPYSPIKPHYLAQDFLESCDDCIVNELLLSFAKFNLNAEPNVQNRLFKESSRLLRRLLHYLPAARKPL